MATETGTRRRLDIKLPPPGSLPGLEEATETHDRLMRERKVTGTRLGGLRGELERARDEERILLARALKDDKPAPKLSKVTKIEKDIEVCEKRLAALDEALDLASDDLIVVADDYREEWTEQLLEEVAEAQALYAQAVEEVASASSSLRAKIALLRWARLFPEQETSYKIRGSNVLALRAPHGDPYSLDEVVQALREDAEVKYDPRAWLSRDPLAASIQALHDARQANYEAGRGYFTDEEIVLKDADPVSFFGGAGARLIQRMETDSSNGNNEEGAE
ncbi:MAG TPA: hypothetical protein VJ837_05545 [Candidatus Paceibacterota bacterium]|nr:hypothetical protein [Candidatus Paceibacterota bacterium]